MDISSIFHQLENKTLDVGFRFYSEGFHCGASENGVVKFGWETSSEDLTIGMLTDLDIPECTGRNGNWLNYVETTRDATSGREVERKYKVVFRAEFELNPDYNFHVVQFKRIPEKSETEEKFIFELYNEALMHLTGEGFPKDKDKAIELLQEAADNDHPGAQKFFEIPEGIEQTDEMVKFAVDMKANIFIRAKFQRRKMWAEDGDAWAQFKVGWAYYIGEGTKKDFAEAVEWTLKSAEQGYRGAQVNLGHIYMEADGGEKDFAKAMEWSLKALDQGSSVAASNIGELYRDGGVGVPQDREKAIEYYTKAVDMGFEKAKGYLTDMGVEYKPKPKEEPKPSSYSDSDDDSYSDSGSYVDQRNGFVSFLFGAVCGLGAAVALGWVNINIRNMESIPKIVSVVMIAIGFFVTFYAWRNRKNILFMVMLALAVPGWLIITHVIPEHLRQPKVYIQTEQTVTIVTVTADSANFRSGPSTSSQVIKTLKKGDVLIVTDATKDGWVSAMHGDDSGFVSQDLVVFGSVSEGETQTSRPAATEATAPRQTNTQEQRTEQTQTIEQTQTVAQEEIPTGTIAEWARGRYPDNIVLNANSITNGGDINLKGVRTVDQAPLSGHPNLKWAFIYVGDKKYGVVWDRTTYSNSGHNGIELGMGSMARSAFDFYSGSDKDSIFVDIAREAPSVKVVKP